MDAPLISSTTRPGTPGLDVFKIAGRSISGFLSSFKTGDSGHVRMPYTTTLEMKLALSLEYHPHVLTFQRGDMSPIFATAYEVFTPLGTPYRISYLYSTASARRSSQSSQLSQSRDQCSSDLEHDLYDGCHCELASERACSSRQ
jgi:hypothetical protein